jgi:SAM-dependent methyltransferase
VKAIINLLRDPSIENMEVDGTERLVIHGKMLARKPMLREVFANFHHIFNRLDEQFLSAQGLKIELGAGVAPIRDSYPDVLATDVVYGAHLDQVLDAEKMDLPDNSVRTIYGQNCFHHFPHPDKFFSELDRVLAPGGGAILLEPYYGPFATFLFKRLFKTEGFDKQFPSWETPAAGPMNGANQALSYIVFVRDKADFERKHPTLKIVKQKLCGNYMKYLLSGGLNFRQLLPNWMSPLVGCMQFLFAPLNRWTALHHIVIIRKESN